MDYAGLDISVILCIASPFSQQIANTNAGPTSALKSMGAKWYFRCHSVGRLSQRRSRKWIRCKCNGPSLPRNS